MDYKEALRMLNLVYPDGIAKGFPLWTEDGLKMQDITIEAFLKCFSKDFNIEINYPREIQKINEFSNKYKDRIQKYDSTIAFFKDENNEEYMYTTDALPYNLEKMDKENKCALLSYYYMIRLLDSKQVPMSRDYYISPLLQFNLAIDKINKNEAIKYVVEKMKEFCKNINLPVVVLEYDGVKGYSEKVYMVSAMNEKGETQTILQCSLLDDELLDSFNVSKEFKNKYIFDIGYSQKIFAYLAYNNMDSFGMRLPSIYENKDIVIIYNKKIKSTMIQNLIQEDEKEDRIYFETNLGVKKLKTIKNQYLRKGVRIIIVQNIKDEIESFKVYSINDKEQIIYDLSNLSNEIKWSSQKGLMFQVEIIKLCNKGQDVKNIIGLEEINTRLQKLEEQVKNGVKVTKVPVENTPKVDKTVPQNEITKKVINGKEGSTGEKWPNILNNLKKSGKILLYTNLINATPVELNDLVIGIEFKNGVTPFIKSVIERAENIVELEKAISMEYGKEMKIKIIDGKTEQVNKIQSDPIDNLPADLDIPINIIED